MNRKRIECSIWEIDPFEQDGHSFEEYEQLFLAAFEWRFHTRAHAEEVHPYLNRYFSYHVVPPWLREYVVRMYGDDSIDDIGHAPLDPAFDWRIATWPIYFGWLCLQQAYDPPIPKGPLFLA